MTESTMRDDTVWSPTRAHDGVGFLPTRDRGLLATHDDGQTWESAFMAVPEAASLPVTAVVISATFAEDGFMLAAIPGGIGRSRDAGRTWVFASLPGHLPIVTCLLMVPDGESTILLAGTLEDGIARSTDRGETWAFWNGGLFDREVIALTWAGDGNVVHATTPSCVYLSRNLGRSWQAATRS